MKNIKILLLVLILFAGFVSLQTAQAKSTEQA